MTAFREVTAQRPPPLSGVARRHETARLRPLVGVRSVRPARGGLLELYLTIHSEGDEPLGSVAAVGAALSALFPGFAVEPVLMRGFARPANLDANGLITFSAPPWAALGPVPTMLGGEVEGPGVVATFYWWSPGPVREVTAKLAGDRPAVEAALSRLSGQPGWVVEPGVECEVPDAEPGAAADGGGR